MTTPDRRKAARDLLAFYEEAGVDALVGEEPVDRFALPAAPAAPAIARERPSPPSPRAAPLPANSSPAAAAPPAPEEAVSAAQGAAKNARSLEELREVLSRFEGCALRLTAKRLVFADGNPKARLMFVGEAPGREEDEQGLPFVGPSGQLLDRMLGAIGMDRNSVYIANIVPWRPPGNRDPALHETQICLPFIKRQIELVDPDVMVCLGKPSMATLLGISDGIRKARGRWLAYQTGKREIRAMPTFHPAYLLRSPLEKRFAWRDFLAIKKALAG